VSKRVELGQLCSLAVVEFGARGVAMRGRVSDANPVRIETVVPPDLTT
jgi:hypothetical protein